MNLTADNARDVVSEIMSLENFIGLYNELNQDDKTLDQVMSIFYICQLSLMFSWASGHIEKLFWIIWVLRLFIIIFRKDEKTSQIWWNWC